MKRTILVVDDDPSVRMLIQTRLEANGYNVKTAGHGGEALVMVAEEAPDLILLDVRMPNMDGWTFLHQLRQLGAGKSIPVLMATAQDKMQELFETEGVAGFIVKPFDPVDLLAKIKSALANRAESKKIL